MVCEVLNALLFPLAHQGDGYLFAQGIKDEGFEMVSYAGESWVMSRRTHILMTNSNLDIKEFEVKRWQRRCAQP